LSLQLIEGSDGRPASARLTPRHLIAATREIAANIAKAASSTQDVSANIAEVSHSTQETGAAIREVVKASDQFSAHADELQREISTFLNEVKAA